MGYFNFYIIKKIINSLFYYIKKNLKFIIIFIIFVCLLFIKEKCFAVTVEGNPSVYDTAYSIIEVQKQAQDSFAIFCLNPFIR